MQSFTDYLASHPQATDDEIMSAIEELGLRSHKAILIIATELFDANIIERKQIETRKGLISRLLKTSKKDKGAKALLGGVERLVGVKCRSLLGLVPVILNTLYQQDLLTEEVILSWHEKSSKKYVDRETNREIHERAISFIQWLQNAEEEEEEEEEEEGNKDEHADDDDGEAEDDDEEEYD